MSGGLNGLSVDSVDQCGSSICVEVGDGCFAVEIVLAGPRVCDGCTVVVVYIQVPGCICLVWAAGNISSGCCWFGDGISRIPKLTCDE